MRKPVHIRIRKFQAVDDLDIEVDGFTCITGPTNIGKSSIIRAVAAAMKNDPVTGDVRVGAKFCSVEARSEGWGFTWEKGEKNGVNRYLIDGEDRHRDKVGQGQIPTVAEMGFSRVRVGDNDVWPWHAEQFDPTFLILDNGPAVTSFFSEVTRLRVLQDAMTIANRGKSRGAEVVRVRSKDVEELETKLERVAGAEDLARVEEGLRAQAESIDMYETRIRTAVQAQEALARTKAYESTLAGLDSVRVPAEPPGTGKLEKAHARWLDLEDAARSIMEVRGVSDIVVPDVPSEFAELSRMLPFQDLPSLQAQVRILDKPGVSPPPLSDLPDIHALARAEVLQEDLVAAALSVRELLGTPDTPEGADLPSALAAGARLAEEKVRLEKELCLLEEEAATLERDLGLVEAEIASIPSCPTCGRVADSHPH